MIDCVPSLTPSGLSRTPKKAMHDMFVDTAVIYCITSLREQTFVANYCIKSRAPTSPSPSPIHSRNIVIEAVATNPEFTVGSTKLQNKDQIGPGCERSTC